MKITVDVSDFSFDNESEGIEEAISRNIKEEVIAAVWKKIEKRVDDQITRSCDSAIEKHYVSHINKLIKEVIESGTVKNPDSYKTELKGDRVTLKDAILYKFDKDSGWRSPETMIKELAKKFGDEMKARYDMFFASQIVIKLNNTGMLKEDAAKALLKDDKDEKK